MSLLPDTLASVDRRGMPVSGARFQRIDPRSDDARALAEADWDEIIRANVQSLADALRVAGLIGEGSTLRVLGAQFDCVDLLLAEVPSEAPERGIPSRLVLLEDKLLRNPQARREVLAQIFEYAHRAQTEWTSKRLAEELEGERSWIRAHARAVDAMLAEGDILLVIAGDGIDEHALRLARRFARHNDPLSRAELCLVAMTLYARGDERLLVPHVVSAVERHQRQVTIRVTVNDTRGEPVDATVKPEFEEDRERTRRLDDPLVAAFLYDLRATLDERFRLTARGYEVTKAPKKQLAFQRSHDLLRHLSFSVSFGGTVDRTRLWPVSVEFACHPKDNATREDLRQRLEALRADGRLPANRVEVAGAKSLWVQRSWDGPMPLDGRLASTLAETFGVFLERIEPLLLSPEPPA